MKVTGKIENILDTKTGTTKAGKEWKKTSFLVKTDELLVPAAFPSIVGVSDEADNVSNAIPNPSRPMSVVSTITPSPKVKPFFQKKKRKKKRRQTKL